jgi:hypothetical protein
MPLTRNLYELAEVVSALEHCFRDKSPITRTLFWVWELVESREIELVETTLLTAWLMWSNCPRPSRSTSWVQQTMQLHADIEASTTSAAQLIEAASRHPWRPTLTPYAKNARIAARRKQIAAAHETELAHFRVSLNAAHTLDAVWLLMAAQSRLSADDIWAALRKKPNHEHQLLRQVHAIMPKIPATPPDKWVAFYQREWAKWQSGRRTSRLFAIPPQALHAKTPRGALGQEFTNIHEIREPWFMFSDGCKYWREVMAELPPPNLNERQMFVSDDIWETFIDKHFPDDIPDEWSRADQEKSHGRGVGALDVSNPPHVTDAAWKCGIHVRDL